MGSHALLHGIFSTQDQTQASCIVTDFFFFLNHWSHQGSPRILEWIAYPRNRTGVSFIAGRFFTTWATREAHSPLYPLANSKCSAHTGASLLAQRIKNLSMGHKELGWGHWAPLTFVEWCYKGNSPPPAPSPPPLWISLALIKHVVWHLPSVFCIYVIIFYFHLDSTSSPLTAWHSTSCRAIKDHLNLPLGGGAPCGRVGPNLGLLHTLHGTQTKGLVKCQ